MKWEYYITNDEEQLSTLGDEGWELVSVINENQVLKLFFKRPAATLKQRVTDEQREKVYKTYGLEVIE